MTTTHSTTSDSPDNQSIDLTIDGRSASDLAFWYRAQSPESKLKLIAEAVGEDASLYSIKRLCLDILTTLELLRSDDPRACLGGCHPREIGTGEDRLCDKCRSTGAKNRDDWMYMAEDCYGEGNIPPEVAIDGCNNVGRDRWEVSARIGLMGRNALISHDRRLVLRICDVLKIAEDIHEIGDSPMWDFFCNIGVPHLYGYGQTDAEVDQFNSDTKFILRWMPYGRYLETSHWWAVREEALERAGNRCQVCNQQTRLQVHHRTYVNRGDEQHGDVIVLCRDCHELFHTHREIVR
jgi:hypothetical protein